MDLIKILGVGDYDSADSFGEYLGLMSKGKIVMQTIPTNATIALRELKSNQYTGIIITDLALQPGEDAEKINSFAQKFHRFDFEGLYVSRGLFLTEYSVQKGLTCAVYTHNIPDIKVGDEARRLGARLIETPATALRTSLEIFQPLFNGL